MFTGLAIVGIGESALVAVIIFIYSYLKFISYSLNLVYIYEQLKFST
jgi:hypothetical protein